MSDTVTPDKAQHARDNDPEEVSVREQRVAHIVGMKMHLKWRRGSALRLATQWGVSEGYVHVLACDANKVVRRSCTDPDAVAADLLPDLLATFRSASSAVRDRGGDPHAQAKMAAAVASLAKVLTDVAGLDAPKKTQAEITGANGGPVQVTGPLIFTPPESDD